MSIARVAPQGISRPDLESERMGYTPARGVPGYAQGLGQAPGQMAMPPEPMPIGRPTAVVGGPAYFTPQGYQAPPQPTEAFMPTDRRPDPIGQQFMRQMESPMGQQFQRQYEATQAPMREAEMARRAEEQAAQDARFQEMMDRIAELEGQLATPTPSPVPEPEPYVPGQTPFPGIPDFSNLDFSGLPDFLNFDYDDIMRQYNDRMEMGEPEPIDSFLPDPKRDAGAMPPENNFFVDGDGNLNVSDGILRPMGMPPGPATAPSFIPEGMSEKFAQQLTDKGIDLADKNYLYQPKINLGAGSRERFMPMPQPVSPTTGSDKLSLADYYLGNRGLEIPTPIPGNLPMPARIPSISAIKPVSMEKIDNNRSMIPNFGNINLR